jgi:hypothetical protein
VDHQGKQKQPQGKAPGGDPFPTGQQDKQACQKQDDPCQGVVHRNHTQHRRAKADGKEQPQPAKHLCFSTHFHKPPKGGAPQKKREKPPLFPLLTPFPA